MINILISILYLIISFTIILICYKKYGKYGLYIWMCISVIMCNIQTIKLSEIFGLTISLGNISYGSIFLTTDIINEKYGKEDARNAIKMSFIAMIIFTLLMNIFLMYKPSNIDSSQEALNIIFKPLFRVTLGSLIAYFVSQYLDTYIYDKLKKKYHKVWISNNISTFISQIIDTIIFTVIAFIKIISFKELIELILTMLIFKWIIALLDTPFMIISTKIKQNNEFDNKI